MEDSPIVFFNVNTQRDFFNGTYKVITAENILNNLNDLTQYALINNIKVINVVGWYPENSKQFSDQPNFRETFPKHCIMNTEGAKFLKETSPTSYFLLDWNSPMGAPFNEIHQNDQIVVTKKSMDFFEGNFYSESLIHNLSAPLGKRPTFLVYGIGINSVVKGLLRRGFSVKVVEDANRTFQGLPLRKEDISDKKVNPYPELINSALSEDDTPIEFVTTKSIISQ